MPQITITQIDALLPQTQCGQCSYAGCKPYAQAIVSQNEMINRCPPGGVKTLTAIAKLLQQDTSIFIEEMQTKQKPPALAKIRESACIGCTKCIQACPVDAIVGSAKQMHTILVDECTGCELCVAPCPVDCIDIIAILTPAYQPLKAKARYLARQLRLSKINAAKLTIKNKSTTTSDKISDKQAAIQAAIARVKAKRIAAGNR